MATSLNNTLRFALLGGMAVATVFLTGCDTLMEVPTMRTEKNAQVIEDRFNTEYQTAILLQPGMIEARANDYRRYGSGPLELTVTYNPTSNIYTARSATEDSGRILRAFDANGIKHIRAEILPVSGDGPSKTLIHYVTQKAEAPRDCEDMEAIKDTGAENYRNYELGCTTESYIARQVYRPGDLLGKGGTTDGDGRRDSRNIEQYTGAFREPLNTMSPSGN